MLDAFNEILEDSKAIGCKNDILKKNNVTLKNEVENLRKNFFYLSSEVKEL